VATHSLRTVATNASPCQEPSRAESAQATDQPQYPLRTHDAWALPVDTLLNALGAEAFERELPDEAKAMLISHRGRLLVATLPGLSGKSKKHLIRLLLTEYIKNGWSAVTLDAKLNVNFSESLEDETHPGEADKSEPPDARLTQITDVRSLYDGSDYAPLHGWRDDEEVITALRELITNALNGTAEDIPDEAYPLPEDLGAAVTIGYDEQGEPHPLVWVRTDLSSGLRADLWGYCAALAVGFDDMDEEPDKDGIYYVGTKRSPVTGPGLPLLAAVTLQRLGRRPEDCAFPILSPPDQAETESPLAA